MRIDPVFEGVTLVAYIGIQTDITVLEKEYSQKEAFLRSEIDINHDLLQVIISSGVSGVFAADAHGAVISIDDTLVGQLNAYSTRDVMAFD